MVNEISYNSVAPTLYDRNTNKVHTNEKGFMRNNPLRVSATQMAIIREVIKVKKELSADTMVEVTEPIRSV